MNTTFGMDTQACLALETDKDPETHYVLCHNERVTGKYRLCENTTIKLLTAGLQAQSLLVCSVWLFKGLWWTLSCHVQLQYGADNSSVSCQSWKPMSFWWSKNQTAVTMVLTPWPCEQSPKTQKIQIVGSIPLPFGTVYALQVHVQPRVWLCVLRSLKIRDQCQRSFSPQLCLLN